MLRHRYTADLIARRSGLTANRGVPTHVKAAYDSAIANLGFAPDGACLEVSVLMHQHLKQAGFKPTLVRRTSLIHGGHWTIALDEQEYDPTILYWTEYGGKGALYVVEKYSPQAKWPKDKHVDVSRAYRCAGVKE